MCNDHLTPLQHLWASQVTRASGREESCDQLMHTAKIDGFGQITRNTYVVGGPLETLGAESGNRDYRYISESIFFADLARSSQSIQPRHADVH